MKILFLDIDGVVLPGRAYSLPYQTKPIVKKFDPCSVALLNDACEQGGWKIVIHSSWLRYWDPSDGESVKSHCIEEGIKEKHFHEEESECNPNLHWRYDRIDDWLSRHEVEDFIILDDTPPDEGYPRADKVLLTDFEEGVTLEVFRKLVK